MEEVRRDSVHLVIGERLGLRVRHGPADIVKHRGPVRPVAPNGAHRVGAGERALPTHELVVGLPSALLAVTCLALLGIDDGALLWRAAPGRQPRAIGRDANIPPGNLSRRGRTAEIRSLLCDTVGVSGYSHEHRHT